MTRIALNSKMPADPGRSVRGRVSHVVARVSGAQVPPRRRAPNVQFNRLRLTGAGDRAHVDVRIRPTLEQTDPMDTI